MVTCKDCIHYERCDTIFDGLLSNRDNEPCHQFDDKSRYIKLPCKVGDTVYIKWGLNSLAKGVYPVKVYALRFDTKKNNMRICVEGDFKITAYGGEYTHYYNGTFAWDSVGKSVFLTREKAERTLKGGEG